MSVRKLPELGEWNSAAEIVDRSRSLLADVLERARRSPFYRSRLEKVGSWESLPLTTKADLRLSYPFGLLAVPRTEVATYHESSGTSGEPTASCFTEKDWEDIASRFARSAVGIRPGDAVMVKTPYSMVTTAHQMHRAARYKGAMVVPASNRSSNMPYSKVIRLLREIPIDVVWCMPTETLLWAEASRLAGFAPERDFPSLRGFLVAGEPLSRAKQKRIGEVWGGIGVYQDYGSTETGSLGGECEHGKMHAWADRVYFEIIDEKTGEARNEGEGELVLTPLFREAMPLVRYAIGDVARISLDPCPCGWNLPTIQVRGRAGTGARVQGREIFQADLEACVYELPLAFGVSFWRARHDESRLEIEIAASAGHEGESCASLTQAVRERTGVAASVSATSLDTLVSREVLTRRAPFQKPRYLFSREETWEQGVHY